MILLRNHHLLRAPLVVPIRTNSSAGAISGTSIVITPGVAVTPGRIMAIAIGGRESRTITPPSGWTLEARAALGFGTIRMLWKLAGGSEPGSYTVNFDNTLTGGYNFFELIDANTTAPIGSKLGANNGAGDTTVVLPTYTIMRQELAYSIIAKDGTSAWTASAGWATGNISGQMKIGIRTYQQVSVNEVLTWTGTSEPAAAEFFTFRPRVVY